MITKLQDLYSMNINIIYIWELMDLELNIKNYDIFWYSINLIIKLVGNAVSFYKMSFIDYSEFISSVHILWILLRNSHDHCKMDIF